MLEGAQSVLFRQKKLIMNDLPIFSDIFADVQKKSEKMIEVLRIYTLAGHLYINQDQF